MARDQPEMYRFEGPLTEESVAELAVLPEMEWRLSISRLMLRLQQRMDENTEITSDTQEMVNRRLSKVDEIAELLAPLAFFVAFMGKLGRAGLWFVARIERCLQRLQRVMQPLLIVGALAIAAWIYLRTGKVPDWLLKVIAL